MRAIAFGSLLLLVLVSGAFGQAILRVGDPVELKISGVPQEEQLQINNTYMVDVTGSISKVGDRMVRTALYEAASVMLTRTVRMSPLRSWGAAVAKRRGTKKARVALARKLGVILHRMWVDGTCFRWSNKETAIA